jgi:hypothetical protein
LASGHGVITAFAPGMAGEYTFQRHAAAFEGSVFLYGFSSISAAGRRKAAAGTRERGNGRLVEADHADKQNADDLTHSLQVFAGPAAGSFAALPFP